MSITLSDILANLQTFKWTTDLLDVLIIAFLIYHLWGFINRSRAGQLAKGFVVVIVVYALAGLASLRTVLWLLENVLSVGVLSLVIIFQPEIRRVLEQMGQTDQWAAKIFHTRHNDPSLRGKWHNAIIAICDAAERLSESQTGALIVLERRTNLSEIIRTGTPVNGEVNPEVLSTIFYEGTPLHDGAVVVEDGMIRAAACVLPLSNNLDLGKDMGTRHRAALGIAENSDAISIVVSEETGIISVGKNGVLIRHFDRQGLYTLLLDEMIPKEPVKKEKANLTAAERIKAALLAAARGEKQPAKKNDAKKGEKKDEHV